MWTNLHYAAIISCKSGFVLQLYCRLYCSCTAGWTTAGLQEPGNQDLSALKLHRAAAAQYIVRSPPTPHLHCTQPGHTTQASKQSFCPSLPLPILPFCHVQKLPLNTAFAQFLNINSWNHVLNVSHFAVLVNQKRPCSD